MGSGASALEEAAKSGSQEDLNNKLSELFTPRLTEMSDEERLKLSKALSALSGEVAPKTETSTSETEMSFEDLTDGCDGCTIEKTEERAIKIKQLWKVFKHIERRCEKEVWKNIRGDKLMPKEVVLYDCNSNVILPSTKAKRIAYVELVSSKQQPPVWFVSHWWGEPVWDFLHCLIQHARDRFWEGPDDCDGMDDKPYWVCAYANNQHKLDEEVTADPAQTSFRKAIDLALGTVSVCDVGAVCYTRIWCDYEVFASLTDTSKKYDIVTVKDHAYTHYGANQGEPPDEEEKKFKQEDGRYMRQAVCLLDGNSFSDCNDASSKMEREAFFPTELVEKMMEICLEKGNASVQKDKVRILNSICGADDLDQEPAIEHKEYDRINKMLNGRLAAAILRRAVEGGGDRLEQVLATIKQAPLDRIQVSFEDCEAFTSEVADKFAESLPKSLTQLDLNLGFVSALPKAICELSNLKELALGDKFLDGKNERGLTTLPDEFANLTKLEWFDVCGLQMLETLPRKLFQNMKNLKTFRYFCCTSAVHHPELPEGCKLVAQ